eukprot:g4598.t1
MLLHFLKSASVCASGFAVEFGWGAGECVMLPFMIDRLHTTPSLASLVYLPAALVGVPLQVWLGARSDACRGPLGRRTPFVLVLAALAGAGLAAVVWTDTDFARAALGLGPRAAVAAVAYAAADIAHDSMLVPGRALAIDRLGETDGTDAMYSAAQATGRLAALVVGSLPLSSRPSGPGPGLSQLQALLLISAGVLAACTAATVIAGGECGGGKEGRGIAGTDGHDGASESGGDGSGGCKRPQDDSAGDGNAGSSGSGAMGRWRALPPARQRALMLLLAVQTLGWVAVETQMFWFTQWIDQDALLPGTRLRLAFACLAAQAVVGILAVPALPAAHRRWGARAVWLAGELLFAAGLVVASRWLGARRPWVTMAVIGVQGVGCAAHGTSVFVLCRDIVRSGRDRALLLGAVGATTSGAQLLVSALSGAMVQRLGAGGAGVGQLMCGVGAAVLLLDALAVGLDARLRLLPRGDSSTRGVGVRSGAKGAGRPGGAGDSECSEEPLLPAAS